MFQNVGEGEYQRGASDELSCEQCLLLNLVRIQQMKLLQILALKQANQYELPPALSDDDARQLTGEYKLTEMALRLNAPCTQFAP